MDFCHPPNQSYCKKSLCSCKEALSNNHLAQAELQACFTELLIMQVDLRGREGGVTKASKQVWYLARTE